jgi:hypothetical protein
VPPKAGYAAAVRRAVLDALDQLARDGAGAAAYEAAWVEFRELVQERARVAAVEWKRLHDMEFFMTKEQGAMLVGAMLAALRETVTDRDTLRRLAEKLRLLVPVPPPGLPAPEQAERDG